MRKTIQHVLPPPDMHWVGNGFPVRSLFSYTTHGEAMSPFLLLDHAGPIAFSPTSERRGVSQHPHRGFETVTVVYDGEVAHQDSTGAGGVIGPGDVQWMTAASGILHEEYHSPHFAQVGGAFEMVQLWVNLPARDKMNPPRYQTLLAQDIPQVSLPNDAGHLRVIAGAYDGHAGPALTHTPINLWDIRQNRNSVIQLQPPAGHTATLVVLRGTVLINDEVVAREGHTIGFSRDGETIQSEANGDALLLFLGGEPINEPIVGHGPYVMNTWPEIVQAIKDFQPRRKLPSSNPKMID